MNRFLDTNGVHKLLLSLFNKISNYLTLKQDVLSQEQLDAITSVPSKVNIEDVYTKTEIDTKISSIYKYKGTVASVGDLPSDVVIGDVYNVEESGMNYAFDGISWDALGSTVDLAGKQDVISDLETIRSGATAGALAEPALPETPESPSTKFLNGNKEWTEMLVGSGGYQANVYLTNTDSTDVSGYKKLSYINDSLETAVQVTLSDEEVLIEEYLFEQPTLVSSVDAGAWRLGLTCAINTATNNSYFKLEAFKRDVDGNEVAIFAKYSDLIKNRIGTEGYQRIVVEIQQSVVSLNPTDRLGLRIYAKTEATGSRTMYYKVGGIDSSYITTPLSLRHSQLRDPNGDDNYLHTTLAKQTDWDGKEDGIVRLAEDGAYSSGYAEVGPFHEAGSYAIIKTSNEYGHVGPSGIIFYSYNNLPKAVGDVTAKYDSANKTLFISSAGYSKVRIVVLDLDKTHPFTGTITHISGSFDSAAGQVIRNTDVDYEKTENRTNTIDSNSTSEEYPSAKAVYDFTKIKSKNFTGSGGGTDIKFAFIPFNANALFSFQRESGAFGEGLMYIRTNNTTVERVVCDSSFRTYDTYFYETSGGVVLCYNVDAEPYNITISTIYDSSGECVLGTTKSLGTQINVDLVKMQESLTSDSTIDISNNVISAVGCKEVIRDTSPISRDLQPNIFTNCKLTVSSWNPICQNHITGIECEYKGRFIANTIFTVGGTDWEGNAITWSGDKDCIASGVYEFSITDNYGIIIKMN